MSDVPPPQEPIVMRPGMHVQPGPITTNVQVTSTADGTKLVVLHFEHQTGSTVVCLPQEMAQALGKQIISQASGLHLVTS